MRWSKKTVALVAVAALFVLVGGALVATAATAPTALTATDTGLSYRVRLVWDGTGVLDTDVTIQQKEVTASNWTTVTSTVTTLSPYIYAETNTSGECTVTGLTNTVEYFFRIKAAGAADSTYIDSAVVIPTDATAPRAPVITVGPRGNLNDPWYSTIPTYSVAATDTSPIKSVEVSVNGTSTPVTVSNNTSTTVGLAGGVNGLYARATDHYDNVSAWSAVTTISVDTTIPTVPGTPVLTLLPGRVIRATWAASTDAESGVSTYTVFYWQSGVATATVTTAASSLTATFAASVDATVCYASVSATDLAGRGSAGSAITTAMADSTAPTVDILGDSDTWSKTSMTATITATDTNSGLASAKYRWYLNSVGATGTFTTIPVTAATTATVTMTAPEGMYDLEVVAVDVAGNITTDTANPYYNDSVTPVTSVTTSPTAANGANGSWTTTPTLVVAVADVPAGTAFTTYARWNSEATATIHASDAATTAVTAPVVPSVNGTHTLYYWSLDSATNTETVKTMVFVVNLNQPLATISLSGTMSGLWYNGTTVATASIAATTNGGTAIANTFYNYDAESTWTTYTAAFELREGVHTLNAYSVDASGVAGGVASKAYKYDKTDPVAVNILPLQTAIANPTLTVSVTDSGSGPASGSMALSFEATANLVATTGSMSYQFTQPLVMGENLVKVTVTDVAGNVSDPAYLTVTRGTYVPTTELSGTDRYDTAILASKAAFADGSAQTVVIARGDLFPDALGGSALAGAVNGPLLLTRTASLPTGVLAELTRLGATKVYVLGGTGAVSAAAFTELASFNATRIAGVDRYATALAVAEETIDVLGVDYTGKAFMATGANFPDALGAAPIAYAKGMPIILAKSDGTYSLPDAVTTVKILGGTGVLPATVEIALDTKLDGVRLAGVDRYDTAAKVAAYGVSLGMQWDGVGIATGADYADGLSGGVMLGAKNSVMLLTPSTALSSYTATALSTNKANIFSVYFIGGTGAVSDTVRTAVLDAIAN